MRTSVPFERLRGTAALLRSGHAPRLWHAVRVRLASSTHSYGLKRDLRVPHAAPAAKVALVVRPLAPGDDLSFLAEDATIDRESSWVRLNQRRLLADDLPPCWVAIDPEGRICYMQWLLTARDNARREARWGSLFPVLAPDEALLEGAYTPESHRGLGVMAHAMARIAEAAAALGVRTTVTFVGVSNIPSLKGCERAGFVPYVERVEVWSAFRRRIRFTPLTAPPAGWSGAPRA